MPSDEKPDREAQIWRVSRQLVDEFGDDLGVLMDARIRLLRYEGDTAGLENWQHVQEAIAILRSPGGSRQTH